MTTIQQRTIDALVTMGYNSTRVIDGIGTPSFIMEATNKENRATVISLIEKHTHNQEYMQQTISRAYQSGYRTIILIAQTTKVMDLFDAYDFHENYCELSFNWVIL
ncbi:MAG: hypothetical protein IKL63_04740 [Alistipes sp.]|nr:hypothetical protein [Alistipes sp.]MBR6721412.1 hypothetical protein [Alistipes sp.]